MKMYNKSGFTYTSPFPPSKHTHIPHCSPANANLLFSSVVMPQMYVLVYTYIYSQS